MYLRNALLAIVCVMALAFAAPVTAEDTGKADKMKTMEGVEALLDLLIEKKVLSEEEAVDFLNELDAKGGASRKLVKRRKGEYKHKEVTSLPEWLDRFDLHGDIRIRGQHDAFPSGNAQFVDPAEPTEPLNTTVDRSRFRYRLRLGIDAEINEDFMAGIRLATGNENDPISTNDTLGDYQNKDGLTLDRAFVKWTVFHPEDPFTPNRKLSVYAGRFKNPFFSTDLVWDNDLNFEGVAAKWEYPNSDNVKYFGSLGVFPLQEVEFSSDDKWLYGAQFGFTYRDKLDRPWLGFKFAAAYYHYANLLGRVSPAGDPDLYDYTAPPFQQKGNALIDIDPDSTDVLTALASEYRILDLLAEVDLTYWDPIRVIMTAEYVHNLGFDSGDILDRINQSSTTPFNGYIPDEDYGYQVGLSVGYMTGNEFGDWRAFKERGDWRVFVYYRYLAGDAVLDAFTDSDFHLGGTNAKGWILGAEYGLARDVNLGFRWLTATEIEGPPLSIDVFQLDLNMAF